MIVPVANPIYDSVFKYLMEDERIAKTILSALLKKDVVHVQVRPHEYANTSRDTLSMFRIDFAATVREVENGDEKERIVLIELQKTWLNTETLRFRQYLGAQYSNKSNILKDSDQGFAYPMVAVYLLGHKLGYINKPVVYVNHEVYDYDGNEVIGGKAEPFVESLTHNSIIVQIPFLRGKVNNRLEQVLSVFDQSQVAAKDSMQVLNIDESHYENDADMMYLIHRLTAAAANAEMRQDMNVEDEYYQAIEDRDTAIMERDQKLKEQEAQLTQQEAQLTQQEAQLTQKDEQLSQQEAQLTQKDEQLSQQKAQLTQKDAQLRAMVRALQDSGMQNEQIQQITGLSKEALLALLGE